MSPSTNANMTSNTTPILNDFNWDEWRPYFKGRLMAKGLRQCLVTAPARTLTPEASIREEKAMGILFSSIGSDQYQHIEDHMSVHAAYLALANYHQPTSDAAQAIHLAEYGRIVWDDKSETFSQFLARFKALLRKLTQCGVRENEVVTVTKLMGLVPWALRGVMHRFNALPESEKKLLIAATMLEEEYQQAIRSGVLKPPGATKSKGIGFFVEGVAKVQKEERQVPLLPAPRPLGG